MLKREDINTVLVIGSGPIIIGQACEFDYSGTQACKALRGLGYKIVLVNSNPATIMTDPETADEMCIRDRVLAGEVYDDAYAKAVELQESEGYTFVHPFDDEDVMEGQGTIALEILEELPDADMILVPIGGGGLISGIAAAAKLIKPDIQIIGVEPEGAASASAAIQEDQVVLLNEVNTVSYTHLLPLMCLIILEN